MEHLLRKGPTEKLRQQEEKQGYLMSRHGILEFVHYMPLLYSLREGPESSEEISRCQR